MLHNELAAGGSVLTRGIFIILILLQISGQAREDLKYYCGINSWIIPTLPPQRHDFN